jgi:CheY-like chemotaxis protein
MPWKPLDPKTASGRKRRSTSKFARLFYVIAITIGLMAAVSLGTLAKEAQKEANAAARWENEIQLASHGPDETDSGLCESVLLLCVAGGAVALRGSKKNAKDLAESDEPYSSSFEMAAPYSSVSNIKRNFLSNTIEETQTPISTIISLSEMSMDSGRMQKEDYEILEKIYNSGVILSNLINDISETAKTGFETFDLASEEYETPDLINETVALNMMLIEDKPVKFDLHIDESFPLKLRGDKLKLKRIFNNILANAFKYSHRGVVDWRLGCERDACDDKTVWLVSEISDTSVDTTEEETRSGLFLTKRMVEMMDGCLSIKNESGSGGLFTARVRQTAVGNETIGHDTARTLMSFHYIDSRQRCRRLVREFMPYASVLVVDSSESSLEIMRRILKPYGMRVDCVDSGQAAVELIMEDDVRYDAILVDYMMPGMDGVETARLIRRIGTAYAKDIPIIALSSNKTTANEDMFIKKGFQAYLAKPVDVTLLNDVIKRWVRDDSRKGEIACADCLRREGIA